MGARGPKPKYENPADLRAAVERYVADCGERGEFPDLAGMRLALGISPATLARRCKVDKEATPEEIRRAAEFQEVLDYAKDCRESWLVRKMTSDNKAAQGCMNALKQPCNGGYIDRPMQDNQSTSVEIRVVGVGGAEAFK